MTKLRISVQLNLVPKKVSDHFDRATKKGVQDIVIDIAGDVVKGSPWLTGNNARSIDFDETSVFSTSGYGGYLEVGTSRMGPRPYFKPAVDKHLPNLPARIKHHGGRG